ncbi:MAG TPA: sigma-70 family RNA polymerase sigma factor [Bryobacteraceae bacterium]|jgi:RNA polymerase sigma-70 factor (ECF subfamily)|nr:sigma-70 family RNA polymerase sigma factor [Bryobacteraceae bacterium]
MRLGRFEAVLLPHLDAAHNLARWLLGNSQDAEDAVQDSYVRALTYFDSFHGEDGRGWLLTIVRNTCYAWLRKNRSGVERTESGQDLELTPDTGPDPEVMHLREADRLKVQQCLEALPTELREALVLREMEGMSYRQIARMTAVPIGTVMSRLARGRRRLQEMLAGGVRKEKT